MSATEEEASSNGICHICKKPFNMETAFHRQYSMCTPCKKNTMDDSEANENSPSFESDDNSDGSGLSFSFSTKDKDEDNSDEQPKDVQRQNESERDGDEDDDKTKRDNKKKDDENDSAVQTKEGVEIIQTFESGLPCGCGCGLIVTQNKHRCIWPNHDKSASVYLFSGFCKIGDDYNGKCLRCERQDNIVKDASKNCSDTGKRSENDEVDQTATHSHEDNNVQSAEDADNIKSSGVNEEKDVNLRAPKENKNYEEWFPASWISTPPKSPKMYLSQHEKDIPLLHQLIPLGAVEMRRRGISPLHLYSRSYVTVGEETQVHILVQLFYFKCTSAPFHALISALDGSHWRVVKDAKSAIKPYGNTALTTEHLTVCANVADIYLTTKRQIPEGVVKDGKYKNYYVWAGARTKHEPDKTEPGYAKYKELYFHIASMKPEILAKAEVLEKSATPTTHDNSDSVDKSTKGGAEAPKISKPKIDKRKKVSLEDKTTGVSVGNSKPSLTQPTKSSTTSQKRISKKAPSQKAVDGDDNSQKLRPSTNSKEGSLPIVPLTNVATSQKKRVRPTAVNDLQSPPIVSTGVVSNGAKRLTRNSQSIDEGVRADLSTAVIEKSIIKTSQEEETLSNLLLQMNESLEKKDKQLIEKLEKKDKQLNDKLEKKDVDLMKMLTAISSRLNDFEKIFENAQGCEIKSANVKACSSVDVNDLTGTSDSDDKKEGTKEHSKRSRSRKKRKRKTKDDSEDTWSRGEYKGHQKRKMKENSDDISERFEKEMNSKKRHAAIASVYSSREVYKERVTLCEENSRLVAENAVLKETSRLAVESALWQEKYKSLRNDFDEKKRFQDCFDLYSD